MDYRCFSGKIAQVWVGPSGMSALANDSKSNDSRKNHTVALTLFLTLP